MDELWAVPTDIALVATFLDPRFKHFHWSTEENRNEAQRLVLILYEELKQSFNAPEIEEPLIMDKNCEEEDDFFLELEGGLQTNPEEDSEVVCYTRLGCSK